jgi:acid phosphatase type 7
MRILHFLSNKWVLFLWGAGVIFAASMHLNQSALQEPDLSLTSPNTFLPLNDLLPASGATLIAAGDIADCSSDADEATARLLDTLPGTIAALGDLAYPNGTAQQFAQCYNLTWGRHKTRTKPALGNHEYHTSGATGYFTYFGTAAGEANKGYYSYSLGDWQIFVLNSNCEIVGCNESSPQFAWLKAELAASPTGCTLAYMHHPLFSSGQYHGSDVLVKPLWQLLYDSGAEVVLAGHEHHYERFAPQTPSSTLDTNKGIRQFVVGTGGKSLYGFGRTKPNSEVRNSSTYGVLRLELLSASYKWQFIPINGKTFTDSGSQNCHNA